jgi:hypothetical protein
MTALLSSPVPRNPSVVDARVPALDVEADVALNSDRSGYDGLLMTSRSENWHNSLATVIGLVLPQRQTSFGTFGPCCLGGSEGIVQFLPSLLCILHFGH